MADGELPVILTCDSAGRAPSVTHEALHVASAAQQAGYPEVIAATMPLRDQSADSVVTALIKN
ncbi:MAG: hypothetical protein QM711_03765 [Micropruina sp.]|uniref:hypothetical protein n=1 Tax=Micropruina sp. TaxID=2737536 RepID=UPI0039E5249A